MLRALRGWMFVSLWCLVFCFCMGMMCDVGRPCCFVVALLRSHQQSWATGGVAERWQGGERNSECMIDEAQGRCVDSCIVADSKTLKTDSRVVEAGLYHTTVVVGFLFLKRVSGVVWTLLFCTCIKLGDDMHKNSLCVCWAQICRCSVGGFLRSSSLDRSCVSPKAAHRTIERYIIVGGCGGESVVCRRRVYGLAKYCTEILINEMDGFVRRSLTICLSCPSLSTCTFRY